MRSVEKEYWRNGFGLFVIMSGQGGVFQMEMGNGTDMGDKTKGGK